MRTLGKADFIIPDWPAPTNVKAIQTTRVGGYSVAPFDSFNLGSHVQDDAFTVAKNRQRLSQYLPSEPVWLNQVHGVDVIDAANSSCVQDADASFTKNKNVVCVTMTADCLPVLLCNQQGTAVASIHAGWRSLCDGVIEATIKSMGHEPEHLIAWLGPAIGPDAFEVGDDVRQAFTTQNPAYSQYFRPGAAGKWLADLPALAAAKLQALGVNDITRSGLCTYNETDRFYSYRRDNVTGRMATMIWITP